MRVAVIGLGVVLSFVSVAAVGQTERPALIERLRHTDIVQPLRGDLEYLEQLRSDLADQNSDFAAVYRLVKRYDDCRAEAFETARYTDRIVSAVAASEFSDGDLQHIVEIYEPRQDERIVFEVLAEAQADPVLTRFWELMAKVERQVHDDPSFNKAWDACDSEFEAQLKAAHLRYEDPSPAPSDPWPGPSEP